MNFIWPVSFQERVLSDGEQCNPAIRAMCLAWGRLNNADWIQVQWPAAIGHTNRFEHVRAGKDYSLSPGGKLL